MKLEDGLPIFIVAVVRLVSQKWWWGVARIDIGCLSFERGDPLSYASGFDGLRLRRFTRYHVLVRSARGNKHTGSTTPSLNCRN